MSIRASVSLKKKDGFLTISDDKKYFFYTPAAPAGASPSVTIAITEIINLQQTPATSAKVALKVFIKDENHVFSFTDAQSARKEQETITETLRNAIASSKAVATNKNATQAAVNGDPGKPAAMAIASAVRSKAADDSWYDDSKLKNDAKLQRSLIASNPALRERFEQALRDQPESLTAGQFNAQFWSTRLHLLRAHAIEKAQEQGEYNVLPEIGFVRVRAEKEGEPDIKQLNITAAQVRLIFRQYPVVREAYDENVPPLDTAQFWTRFFNSRLLKKLKGEKITPQDPADSLLDKYLERREAGPASIAHIPHFIDLEGNEQNHSQRKGNRPDETMRPSTFDKVPILRVLNNLSEKMLSHVAPEDGEAHAPIGLNEETFEQLRLRDLANEDVDNRVVLNIREQQRLLGDTKDSNAAAEARAYAQQDPVQVLASLTTDMQGENLGGDENGTLRLDSVIGYDPDEDSDGEDERMTNGHTKIPRLGSKSAMEAASASMFSTITQKRVAAATDPKARDGLSETTFTALTTTQNTTTEFLHYFWNVFLSGDASRSAELAQLVSTLDRSLDRINSVGDTAEQERGEHIKKIKTQIEQYYQKTGKRRRYDFDTVLGGRKVVDTMIRPTVAALKQAENVYRKALEEQTAGNGAVAG
ncbi:hypothetical protein AMS68_004564 [Peltaster fructicola]|uniref:BSD domain-containing protein n=1 Tax=Peltaster fructicola TaxID=286661 RepID=A0A6H0XWA9_9PEZI|nr:hypothetical protein AMS68_004564 [Peltaster fructicola]